MWSCPKTYLLTPTTHTSGFLKITTGGAPREIGHDIGRASADIVRELLAANQDFYRRRTGHSAAWLADYARRNFLPCVRRVYPAYVEELRGLAEGADVRFEDVFVFSAEEELLDLWGGDDKCSGAAVRHGGRWLLLHNEDYIGRYRGRLLLIEATPTGRPAFLSLAYPGTLAGSACCLNAAGLAFAGYSLRFGPRQRGLPKNFILRDLLAARSAAAAVRKMRVGPRLVGGSANIVSASEDAAVCVETSLTGSAVIRLDEGGHLAHTNHALAPRLDKRDEKPSISSYRRLAALEDLLAGQDEVSLAFMKTTLSSRRGGLLRLGRRPAAPATLASIIMDPRRRAMYIADRSGQDQQFREYRLGRR